LKVLLSGGMSVFAFDMAGSGMSQGEYVSLGFYERDDLAAVVAHLRDQGNVSTLGLWGRSMGAATALMHGHRDPSIAGMVVDSAFSSLEKLAEELVDCARQQGHTIPGFVVSIAMSSIKGSVREKAKFEISDLTPIENADSCFIPALFAHATGDELDGDHNTPRPQYFLNSAGIFLSQTLQVPPELMLDPELVNMGRPPWRQGGASRFEGYTARDTMVGSPGGGGEGEEADAYDEEMMQRMIAESMAVQGSQGGVDDVNNETSKAQGQAEAVPEARPPPAAAVVEPDPELVKQIVEMGFEEAMAQQYLAKTGNDVQAAVQCILSNM
jgi:pimeloyl-ACP methyl ester carboxylesterase